MKKICKECGKEFEATDGRQKYCNRQHFRPCPVCGKLIEVIHLSNPTPKCSECGKHRIRKPKPTQFSLFSFDPKPDTVDTAAIKSDVSAPETSVSEEIETEDRTKVVSNTKPSRTNVELNIHSEEYVTRKYTGRTTCGFVQNHVYTVGLVSNNPYGYIAHAILDQTEDDDVNIGLNISSENSWKHFFVES